MLRTAAWAGFLGSVALATALATSTRAVRADDAPAAEKPAYVGPETCKKCHLKQFKSWRGTAMSKSVEALKPNAAAEKKKAAKLDPSADYSKDPKCLKCHSTGYGTETGYPAVVDGKEWTDDEKARAERLSGTTCEACHGAGSLYAAYKKDHEKFKLEEIQRLGATSPPKAEQCMACHVKECPTMGADYAFDFEKAKVSKDVHEHIPLKYQH
jgi:hypothetical protein